MNHQVSQRMRDTFRFGSKAETLERLAGNLLSGRLCDQVYFSSGEWEAAREDVLIRVVQRFAGMDLVVRSSALFEDGALESLAGAYRSCVGVECRASAIESAADQVLASYGCAAPSDQVLIQPQVQDVAISGVVMTRELNTGAPYYVINYDDFSGRTDGVTSGAISKVVLIHRSRSDALTSERMRNLVGCIQSIEGVTGSDRLDIEFCIDLAGQIFILQVRPLAASNKWSHVPDTDIDTRIDDVRKKLADYSADPNRQDVLGSYSIFGNMPDWNPAEMIGSTPRPLAYSLYEKLVTRESWAIARSTMGYRDLTGHPLMVSFAEQPFIDVRLSLNSFLPASVADRVGEKLVEYQLSKLTKHPEFHDKIEFEISVPSADFTLPRKIDELREAGFDEGDLEHFQRSLTNLTIDIVDNGLEAMRRDEAEIESLMELLEVSAEPVDLGAAIDLLDRCAAEGVVLFARLARHGFVGVSFLKSLQEIGLLEPGQADLLLTSVRTIANEIVLDMNSVAEGGLSVEEFLRRYGHLRPGTYDITSPRYDHDPEHYLGGSRHGLANREPFQMTPEQGRSISDALAEFGFRSRAEGLLEYIAEAIRLRELAKFRLTRVLSHCLESIAAWGEAHELDREHLSFLSLTDLNTIEPGALKSKAEQARRQFDVDRNVRLPHLIRGIEDVDVIRVPLNEPSYITQERVSGPVTELSTSEINFNIDGHIVLIESADPGFDWIFSHDIKALLTKYGGANSHMAIRCAEFRVPAGIGCGDRLYDMAAAASIVEINCGARTIKGNER